MTITVRECWWGISYTGYREDLVAAGHLREEWIRPKPYKNATLSTMLPDGRKVCIYKKRDKLEIVYHFTDAECAARRAKEEALDAARRARAEVDREVASWPSSKQDFARRLERYAVVALELLLKFAKDGIGGGYRVAPESAGEIAQAMLQLGEALQAARIEFHPDERAREEARRRSKAASHDPAFGAFLERAITAPEDGESVGGAA